MSAWKLFAMVCLMVCAGCSQSALAQACTMNAAIAGADCTPVAPAPMSGIGAPGTLCDATHNVNNLYYQTDARAGSHTWVCLYASGSTTYGWQNVVTPANSANTTPIAATTLAAGGCVSTTVSIAGAVVGANAAVAAPLGPPTSSASTAGLLNTVAYVSAANTVTVSLCANALGFLLNLTTAAVPYRVFLY